jgi:hypothetical protein
MTDQFTQNIPNSSAGKLAKYELKLKTSLLSSAKFSGRSLTMMMPKLSGPNACSNVSRETVPSWSSFSVTDTAAGRSSFGAMEPIFEKSRLLEAVAVRRKSAGFANSLFARGVNLAGSTIASQWVRLNKNSFGYVLSQRTSGVVEKIRRVANSKPEVVTRLCEACTRRRSSPTKTHSVADLAKSTILQPRGSIETHIE